MAAPQGHPLLVKWKDKFPREVADDEIFKILKSCSFDELQIGDAIERLWDDQGTGASAEHEWVPKPTKREKKKKGQIQQLQPAHSIRRTRDNRRIDAISATNGRGRGGAVNRSNGPSSR